MAHRLYLARAWIFGVFLISLYFITMLNRTESVFFFLSLSLVFAPVHIRPDDERITIIILLIYNVTYFLFYILSQDLMITILFFIKNNYYKICLYEKNKTS